MSISISIELLSPRGDSVGLFENMPVFIADSLPGKKVETDIL